MAPTVNPPPVSGPGYAADQKPTGIQHVEKLDDEQSAPKYDGDIYSAATAREKRLVYRVDLRVLPMLAIVFAVSIIDRINVGSAKVLGMEKDLTLTGNRYNVILLTFFPAYLLAELPSNYLLVKFRPKIWLSFLIFAWGAVLTGMAFTNSWQVAAFLRFLLGAFEGGLLPGLVYIISSWFVTQVLSPPKKRVELTPIVSRVGTVAMRYTGE